MKRIFSILGIFTTIMLSSCDPRIEMDMAQWGDHAILTNVQVFKFEVDDDPALYETATGTGEVSGIRRIIISNTATIDLENATATLSLKGEETLDEAGFIFFHESTKIEPLNGAPEGGHVADLSAGSFQYRLTSADGTIRDWTISIE